MPAAILWAQGAIQGPRPLYVSEDNYWVVWLLIAVPVAALTGVVIIIVGVVLTFLNRKNVP